MPTLRKLNPRYVLYDGTVSLKIEKNLSIYYIFNFSPILHHWSVKHVNGLQIHFLLEKAICYIRVWGSDFLRNYLGFCIYNFNFPGSYCHFHKCSLIFLKTLVMTSLSLAREKANPFHVAIMHFFHWIHIST